MSPRAFSSSLSPFTLFYAIFWYLTRCPLGWNVFKVNNLSHLPHGLMESVVLVAFDWVFDHGRLLPELLLEGWLWMSGLFYHLLSAAWMESKEDNDWLDDVTVMDIVITVCGWNLIPTQGVWKYMVTVDISE